MNTPKRAKILIFLGIMLVSPVALWAKQDPIKDAQLSNYITHVVEFLFYPQHKHYQVKNIIERTISSIRSSTLSENEWSWSSFSYEIVYPFDLVQDVIRGAILDSIKETSYASLLDLTGDKNISFNISKQIHNNALRIFEQSYELERGAFASYAGSNLTALASQMYYQHGYSNSHFSANSYDNSSTYPSTPFSYAAPSPSNYAWANPYSQNSYPLY